MTILETARLRVRQFEASDVENLYGLYSDPAVMRFMPGGKTRDRAKAEEHIPLFAQQFEKTGYSIWAVEQKNDGEFVGRAGLWPLPGTGEVELGYITASAHWGKGFATEASVGCLEFGFRRLALERIAAVALPDNGASLRILEKLGFTFIRKDRFYDVKVLYHRLERGDWLASIAEDAPGIAN